MTDPTADAVRHHVDALVEAFCGGPPAPALTAPGEGVAVELGRHIRDAAVTSLLERGRTIVGYKIGLTSPTSRQRLGTTRPEFGYILDGTVMRGDPGEVPSGVRRPALEPEIAVTIGSPLRGGDVGPAAVAAAISSASPAFEVVDFRTSPTPTTLGAIIADDVGGGGAIIGPQQVGWSALDLARLQVTLDLDGTEVGRAIGFEPRDHPEASLLWLVHELASSGRGLEPGDVVLTGSWLPPTEVSRSAMLRADFGPLGMVRCRGLVG